MNKFFSSILIATALVHSTMPRQLNDDEIAKVKSTLEQYKDNIQNCCKNHIMDCESQWAVDFVDLPIDYLIEPSSFIDLADMTIETIKNCTEYQEWLINADQLATKNLKNKIEVTCRMICTNRDDVESKYETYYIDSKYVQLSFYFYCEALAKVHLALPNLKLEQNPRSYTCDILHD